jgi:hypothetical protein
MKFCTRLATARLLNDLPHTVEYEINSSIPIDKLKIMRCVYRSCGLHKVDLLPNFPIGVPMQEPQLWTVTTCEFYHVMKRTNVLQVCNLKSLGDTDRNVAREAQWLSEKKKCYEGLMSEY